MGIASDGWNGTTTALEWEGETHGASTVQRAAPDPVWTVFPFRLCAGELLSLMVMKRQSCWDRKGESWERIQFYSRVFLLASSVFTEQYWAYVAYTECCSGNTQSDLLQCKYFLSPDAVMLLPEMS